MELVIFAAFIGLQGCAKALPTCFSRIERMRWAQRLSRNHWIVWLAHPAFVHGMYDYAVHFVVYSGYVIRAH